MKKMSRFPIILAVVAALALYFYVIHNGKTMTVEGEGRYGDEKAPLLRDESVTAPSVDIFKKYNQNSVSARIRVAGREENFQNNSIGLFPRVRMDMAEPVEIALRYPESFAGASVRLRVLDGGTLEGGKPIFLRNIGDDASLRFVFNPESANGLYRVVAEVKGQRQVIQLWLGPEAPVVHRTEPVGKNAAVPSPSGSREG